MYGNHQNEPREKKSTEAKEDESSKMEEEESTKPDTNKQGISSAFHLSISQLFISSFSSPHRGLKCF